MVLSSIYTTKVFESILKRTLKQSSLLSPGHGYSQGVEQSRSLLTPLWYVKWYQERMKKTTCILRLLSYFNKV